MKNKLLKNKYIFTLFVLNTTCFTAFSQIVPTVDWKNVSYESEGIQGTAITQEQSGDEWWYSHKNLIDPVTTKQNGYIAVGYLAYILNLPTDITAAKSIFNEGINSPYNDYPLATISATTWDDCVDFVGPTKRRTQFRGMVSRLDLKGNMMWCKQLTFIDLQEVIQVGNYIYVIGTHAGAKKMDKSAFIPYNNSVSSSTNFFDKSINPILIDSNGVQHMYVSKLDLNGNVIWEGIYGYSDFSNIRDAWNNISVGFDLIMNSNGSLYAVGVTKNSMDPIEKSKTFVIKINPLNGQYLDKKLLPLPTNLNMVGVGCNGSDGRSITEIDSTTNMAIASVLSYYNATGTIFTDWHRGGVYSIDQNLNLNTSWSTNPITFQASTNPLDYQLPNTSGNPYHQTTLVWELNYHQARNEILVGVLSNCNICSSSGANFAKGFIYRLTNTGQFSTIGTNPSVMGNINAFDLRIGVVETNDGGFVAGSARRNGIATPPTSYELGTFASCSAMSSNYSFWDTDPLIVKFDTYGNKTWEWSEDVIPGRSRQLYPGDVKRQECMYKITQTQDGGYALSGNASFNNDDNYMVKLNSDCNSLQTFDVVGPYYILPTSPSWQNNWTSSHKVKGIVYVKNGATLTISGSGTIIEFADSKQLGIETKIVVEAGGKLIINGGAKLTSVQTCPGSVWNGIQVQGNKNFKQITTSSFDPNHGTVIINNATLQNAIYAIENNVSNSNGIDWLKLGGGIIQCNNVSFINCQKGANFLPYTNMNVNGIPIADKSYFKNCTFKTDLNLNPPYNYIPETAISMWQTKGIIITGNNFINDTPFSSNIYERGKGITSYDATFDVNRDCSVVNATTGECAGAQNIFKNLFYGIDAAASLPSISLMVRNSSFLNNHRGVVLHGLHYAKVNNNYFTIGEPYVTSTSQSFPGGLYLDGCDAYQVQNNTLTNAVGTSKHLDFGIIANFTGANPNELRQNIFSDIEVGIQAQNQNSGLQIKCNKFITGSISDADISVVSTFPAGTGPANGSIAQQQGACFPSNPTTLAGNEFSQTCGTANDLHAYFPYYSTTQYNTRTSPLVEFPNCYNSYFNPQNCYVAGGGSVCPPVTCCNTISSLRIAIYNSKQDLKNLEQIIASGNDTLLYNILATEIDDQIKTELLNKSPYLSDSILIEMLKHYPQLTDPTITEVLVANSPLTQDVLNVFNNMIVDNATYDAVKIAQVGQSQRKYTELGIAFTKSELTINYNNLISFVLNDISNETRYDTLFNLFDFNINPNSRAAMVSSLIELKDYDLAQKHIDSLQYINNDLSNYLSATMQIYKAENQQLAYDGNTQSLLETIRQSNNLTFAIQANALYNSLFNARFDEKIYHNTPSGARLTTATAPANLAIDNANTVTVFPNPASSELYVMCNVDTESDVKLNLYDISGRLLKTETLINTKESQKIDMHDLMNGVYLYKIINNNTAIKTGKIIILK